MLMYMHAQRLDPVDLCVWVVSLYSWEKSGQEAACIEAGNDLKEDDVLQGEGGTEYSDRIQSSVEAQSGGWVSTTVLWQAPGALRL